MKTTFISRFALHRNLLCALALAAMSLPACAQPRTDAAQEVAAGLNYKRSWVGNSFGSAGQKNAKWVQNNIVTLWTSPDGRCYTASSWDEAKREGGIYKDGDVVGNLANLHPEEGGGWGMSVSAISGAGEWIYVGIKGNVRRYKMDGGHAPFEGGAGKWKNEVKTTETTGYVWALSADAKTNRLFVAFRGEGARPAKDKEPATEKVPDEIVVLDLKTMSPLARWNLPRAGRLASAPDGTVWIAQEADAAKGVAARILHFDASGKQLAGEISDRTGFRPVAGNISTVGFSPTALHFNDAGALMVADNGPDQQIKIYDVAGTPKMSGTFGQKGGVFSGVAGEVKPLKFCGLTGVGTDALGNIYVSQNRFGPHVNGSEGAGANLESYNSQGKRNWQLLGLEFVDGGDFVPGTDGAQIYSKYTRYNLDLTKTEPGSEWNYSAHTLNQFKYPNDPRFLRIRDHFDFSTTAFVRVLGGKRFMFNTSMWGWRYIEKLQAALKGIENPVAKSSSSTVWAVPHTTGDVQYVSVVNWGFEPGQNASYIVKPQTGTLEWNTTRAIYDLDAGGKMTAESAKSVDLTKDGFQIYALPSKPIVAPKISTEVGADGFYRATVDVNGMRGVPVQIQLVRGGEAAQIFGSSGEPIALPFKNEEVGSVTLTATELLGELSASATVKTTAARGNVAANSPQTASIERFLARRTPLVLALTPAQKEDAKWKALAARLVKLSAAKGRRIEMGDVAPNGVILSPQPLKTSQSFPRWRTVEADLILLGTPADNLLVFDQLRGGLLSGEGGASVTYSPFVGEFNALNLVGDAAQIEAQIAGMEG